MNTESHTPRSLIPTAIAILVGILAVGPIVWGHVQAVQKYGDSAGEHLAYPDWRILLCLPLVACVLGFLRVREKPVNVTLQPWGQLIVLCAAGLLTIAAVLFEWPFLTLVACYLLLVAALQLWLKLRTLDILVFCSPILVLCILPTQEWYDLVVMQKAWVLTSLSTFLDSLGVANIVEKQQITFVDGALPAELLVRFFMSPYTLLALLVSFLAYRREKVVISLTLTALLLPFAWLASILYGLFGVLLILQEQTNLFEGRVAVLVNLLCFGLIMLCLFLTWRFLVHLFAPFETDSHSAGPFHSAYNFLVGYSDIDRRTSSSPKPPAKVPVWAYGIAPMLFFAAAAIHWMN